MPAVSKPLLGRNPVAGPWREAQGRYVRELRHAAGLTGEQLADALGCGKSFISHVEAGTNQVPPEKLEVLAKAVGKSIEEISKPMLRFQHPWIYAGLFGTKGDPELRQFLKEVPSHLNIKRGPRKD